MTRSQQSTLGNDCLWRLQWEDQYGEHLMELPKEGVARDLYTRLVADDDNRNIRLERTLIRWEAVNVDGEPADMRCLACGGTTVDESDELRPDGPCRACDGVGRVLVPGALAEEDAT